MTIDQECQEFRKPKRWEKFFISGCTLVGIVGGIYFIKEREQETPTTPQARYESVAPIDDQNNDGIPEFQATYDDGTTEILYSKVEGQKVIHAP